MGSSFLVEHMTFANNTYFIVSKNSDSDNENPRSAPKTLILDSYLVQINVCVWLTSHPDRIDRTYRHKINGSASELHGRIIFGTSTEQADESAYNNNQQHSAWNTWNIHTFSLK